MNELTLEPADWRNYLRMDEPTYFKLLELVTPLIQKQNINMREAITPHERLSATIRFLASGMTYEELKFITAISPQRLGVIIPETCRAILHVLKDFMKMPETPEDWKKIAREYEEQWQFSNCVGAIDGKYIRIIPPRESGYFFFNYKGFHSIVLMACANPNYEFIRAEVGETGRVSDGGSIKQTTFYSNLVSNNLNIPKSQISQSSSVPLPYVFVGDGASPQREEYLITNSRARRIIENIFIIMSNRFRISHTAINLRLDRIDLVMMTCCILHNFLRKSSSPYSKSDLLDIEDNIIDDVLPSPAFTSLETIAGNSSHDAKLVRDAYVAYFNGEGSVAWQNDRI